ncbi:cysteine synthase A [Gryllotalpicola ginsengisoli]|uniref:cysteine synthase A n=1 Tax=Gryllotalpicola ginsengisoli TaxID=444608 RepID=UPI0003B45324|nr:cysteine synthase A [Gryllotalpicola ginsengisoli]
MARILSDITQAVGGTPLVKLNRVVGDVPATVLAKLEFFNPASSVKDRIAVAIVDAAEKAGALQPGGTIVEATSGNTGIGLAMVGAARGYKTILVMPDTMSTERRMILRAFGAELVLTPGADGMKASIAKVQDIVAETPGSIWARQFENEANPAIHYATTGPEIWDATDGAVDVFVAGVGTGGTITGAGRYLKEQNPSVHVVAIEPAETEVLRGGAHGTHKIQGIGAGFVPEVLDREVYDEVFPVPSDEAIATSRRLATEEGIFAGISAGASVYAAIELAKRPEFAGKTIVAVVPDTGERYFSTALFRHLADADS